MQEIAGAEVLQLNAGAATEINENDLVKPGKKGVTNAQMIPVIIATIDADDPAKLILLKKTFPQVYASSLKYLGKEHKAKIEAYNAPAAVEA